MKMLLAILALLSPLAAFAGERISGAGVALQQNEKHFYVGHLVPGAPAQLDGTIRAGDEIVSVQPAEGAWVDVADLGIDEVVQLVRGEEGSRVSLHLDGPSGQYRVTLTRATFEVPRQ